MKNILLPLAMPLLMIFMLSCSEDDVSATSNNRKDIVLYKDETTNEILSFDDLKQQYASDHDSDLPGRWCVCGRDWP